MKKLIVTALSIIGGYHVIKFVAKEEKWKWPKPEIRVRVIFGNKKEF